MKRRVIVLIMLMSFLMTACNRDGNQEMEISEAFQLYYLSTDLTEIVSYEYTLQSETLEEMVKECIEELSDSPNDDYVAPLTSGIELNDYTLENSQLSMDFGNEYLNLTTIAEVLTRAAIVKTLVQIPGVEYVSFYVEGAPLRDAKDNIVGVMSKDSFVNNVGQQMNTIDAYDITLYYATEDGTALVAEHNSVYATTNTSLEKLVLSHLMKKPSDSTLQRTIPEGTKLISVTTLDGVCFVNFDEKFLEYNYQISDEVAFYSIVNSLCEIAGVNKVQISVNGKTDLKFRETYSLEEIYERNLDCILKEE